MESVIVGKERFTKSERKLYRPECFNDLDLIDKLTELKAYQWQEFPANETLKHIVVVAVDTQTWRVSLARTDVNDDLGPDRVGSFYVDPVAHWDDLCRDIDAGDLDQVLWAMSTRFDPASDIDLIQKAWASKRDPLYLPGNFNNRILIDACIPYDMYLKDTFPPVVDVSPEMRRKILDKFGHLPFPRT